MAVQAFLDNRIGFLKIPELIAEVMNRVANCRVTDLAGIMEQDAKARLAANLLIN